jgi:hypothetical protein
LWSVSDLRILESHERYRTQMIEKLNSELSLIRKAKAEGKLSIQEKETCTVTRPLGNLDQVMFFDAERKAIDRHAFNMRLKSLKVCADAVNYWSSEEADSTFANGDLNEIAIFLNDNYAFIRNAKNDNLKEKLKFGHKLFRAKQQYATQKMLLKASGIKTWKGWVKLNLTTSLRYADICVSMYKLVDKFPKLADLSISFTELYKMSSKITEVFEDTQIAAEWK